MFFEIYFKTMQIYVMVTGFDALFFIIFDNIFFTNFNNFLHRFNMVLTFNMYTQVVNNLYAILFNTKIGGLYEKGNSNATCISNGIFFCCL